MTQDNLIDKKIKVEVETSDWIINSLKRELQLPENLDDKELFKVLIEDLIDRYLYASYFSSQDVKNWLDL